jgi:hypothetical protein
MYKILNNLDGVAYAVARTNEDESVTCFQLYSNGSDYQAYLAWIEAGNTPLPADSE